MEDCVAEQITDLDVKHGELVHILSKNQDGRWRAFVIRGQVRGVLSSFPEFYNSCYHILLLYKLFTYHDT